MFKLDQANVGDFLHVKAIPDPNAATMAMRLGIAEGEQITIAAKVPGGPMVIRRGAIEIALGRDICQGIEVEKQ